MNIAILKQKYLHISATIIVKLCEIKLFISCRTIHRL